MEEYSPPPSELESEVENSESESEISDFDFEVELDPVQEKVFDIIHKIALIDAPQWFINPDFRTILGEQEKFDSITSACSLQFPPTLLDTLCSPSPPAYSYFKTLPAPSEGIWAVYAVCLKKVGEKQKLYIGSGTAAEDGVLARVKIYNNETIAPNLPRMVKTARRDGFEITHVGLLCWAPIPTPGLVPRSRGLFLAAEATFSKLFQAVVVWCNDYLFDHIILWDREHIPWDPLCSHFCLNEGIRGDLSLSFEELEQSATRRRKNRKAAALIGAKRSRERRRREDLIGYRAKDVKMRNAWAARNRDKVNKTAAKVRAKNKSSERFRCDPCELDLQSQKALNTHLACQAHKDKLAGIVKPPPSARAVTVKAIRAQAKADRSHFCSVCSKPFNNDWSLQRHFATPRHQKKAAASQNS